MKLYYSPGACSLAPHIALQESGISFTIEPVNLKTHHFKGGDFYKVNNKGYVPTLELDDGQVLTEVAVILQYIADKKPDANLIPAAGTFERYRCQEWLNFVATELHKGFGPLWKDTYPEEAKAAAKETLFKRFDLLGEHLGKHQYLSGDRYTVADAYLFTILNWSNFLKVDMSKWPTLLGFMERVTQRPAVQQALKAEGLTKK